MSAIGVYRRRRRARRGDDVAREIGDVLDIPVTPLIDVMMCLLIVFMIITPVITYYGAKVPRAEYPKREKVDDAISVGIRRDGLLFMGKDTIQPGTLATRLHDTYDGRPGDHLLYLWADGEVPYKVVLGVVDAARAAGVRTIGAIVAPVSVDEQNAAKKRVTGATP